MSLPFTAGIFLGLSSESAVDNLCLLRLRLQTVTETALRMHFDCAQCDNLCLLRLKTEAALRLRSVGHVMFATATATANYA